MNVTAADCMEGEPGEDGDMMSMSNMFCGEAEPIEVQEDKNMPTGRMGSLPRWVCQGVMHLV